jgi:DNA polymerase-1|tara:strand:- start:1899 stop:4586 length:2688 start_codon:yes stop_codon:yes gene_type:complete
VSKGKLILVDGSSYLYRAFHALPPLANSKGHPTGAIYGVINMINKLLHDQGTDHFVVIFDAPGTTFRNDLYSEYKANRPPMPDDLRPQIKPIHQIIKAMGLPLIMIKNVEADDVIGTLSKEAASNGMDVIISTGDKDMTQLVDQNITLINTMNDEKLDRDGVKQKFDVYPEQIIDYLTLMGDKADNIPGIPGVGAKTASKWLNKYLTLENLINKSDEISGKIGEKFRSSLNLLPLSKKLVTIDKDLDLRLTPSDLKRVSIDTEKLKSIYKELELKTFYSQISETPDKIPLKKSKSIYKSILNKTDLMEWVDHCKQKKIIAIDTETNSLNYIEAELVGISLSIDEGKAIYIPLAHDYENAPLQLDRVETLNILKPLLEDKEIKKIGHHLKFDAHIFARYGITLKGMEYDSMLESYVLNSVASRHGMNSVAQYYLNRETTHFEDVAGKGAKQITFNQVDIKTATAYAAEDADVTLCLHNYLWEKINHIPSLKELYQRIEMPLIPILFEIEETGVLVDKVMLKKQSDELLLLLNKLEKNAHKIAGMEFNLGSPKQLQEVLYEKMEIPIIKKTPKGQPSTAEDVLQELSIDHELPKLILSHRSLNKLRNTYTEKLPQQISAVTGRIHTSYHQAVTATGRLSSSSPNLQNIPIRTPEGRRIREAFVAPENYSILAADYSQIELRIMAHLSSDESLLLAFSKGEDIHRKTAAEVLGIAAEEVSQEQRRWAKAINFGLMYGMSAFGLAKQLGITRYQSQEYIDLYFKKYPKVKNFMDTTKENARKHGYIETLYGRRLYLPDINSKNGLRRKYAERSAINAPMQGSAADIIKLAMIDVHKWLKDGNTEARMIMQVHDELVLEVKSDLAETIKQEIVKIMESTVNLSVPLIVDAGIGNNWDEAH